MTGLKLAREVAKFASDVKAENIQIMDMRKAANFCDYFVLCTGHVDRQVRAIAQRIQDGLEEVGLKAGYLQGMKSGHWILIDLGDVVVHVFDQESREFYGLDHLWQDAKKVKW
ncbi:MAG: ribosome silencing factor, partial [Candidatus Omnitrophica bacterium]|nr:ribosome silencing factor [Candidatus Omnitrophota bacterium]